MWLPLAYVCLALAPESASWGRKFLSAWPIYTVAALVLLWASVWTSTRRRPGLLPRLTRLAIGGSTAALTMLAADNAYWAWERWSNRVQAGDMTADLEARRIGSAIHRYYPTEKNFAVYRPSASASGRRYGDLYSRALLKSPTLAAAVLTRHEVTYSIDRHGFRETTPMEQAHIFALGDSFTFGGPVRQEDTWVKRLEHRLGAPTYNLGVNAASPRQELLLLRHVLGRADAPRIRHLLWMIFEGNDLEDTYDERRPPSAGRRGDDNAAADLAWWVVGQIGREVRERSFLYRALAGTLATAPPIPVYFSSRHGWKAFHPEYIARAAEPPAYVERHPHRPLLDQTLREMKLLSERADFTVTVLLAPSDARLYGRYFERFPPPSSEPSFLDHVERTARSLNLPVLNLYPLLQPYAEGELLYFRDDTHWNERGNAVVASLIAETLFPDRFR